MLHLPFMFLNPVVGGLPFGQFHSHFVEVFCLIGRVSETVRECERVCERVRERARLQLYFIN